MGLKIKTLAERRRSAPSLTLQKQPSNKQSPSSSMDKFLSSFMCSNRTLLIDGRVELKRGRERQERHLFLFNDLFVVAQIKYNNNFKMKNKINLSDMWTASCVSEVEGGNTDNMKSFVLGWPTVNFVATFSFPEQKDVWLSLLQRYIKAEKEKDYPKSIPLKIFTKDIGDCAYSKTVTIKNSDTASEVINMSLSILGITGSERDYQLWVNSGKEKAPYPLIGHEYPYGIKMSHLRDTALLAELSKDSISPSSLQEPFLTEELPREMQCQFILKPSLLAKTQQLSDSGQKTSKKRRSIINWAIWRGSRTHQDNSPVSPTSPVPGQIFGVSLPSLCENDSLPKPVLDMLCFLNQKGPLTKGIFRISANVKSCRELKEKLNSGSEVHLDCESVFVIASVLKDFLRNIPGSVFSSDLYDRWICVMDQGNDEEKINTIQRLLDQLPRANVVLLRHLFEILRNIERQAASNHMTAFNLAVCIGPSLLWPSTSSSSELESELTKKVSQLIQFVIENCHHIFGEEISSLFGEVSVTCDSKENASDIPCIKMNESSYENELNEDINELNEVVDTPCNELLKKHDQGSTDMKKNTTNKEVKEESSADNDGNCVEPHPESKPLAISEVSSRDHPQNVPFDSSTSEYSLEHTAGALESSREHECCSEPSSHDQHCKPSHLVEIYSEKQRKTSYEAGHLEGGDVYLDQQQSLQMEGQKLNNQSLVMVIEEGKSNAMNENTKKDSPSSLNTCPSTSSSNLSSASPSPSGSSASSKDSGLPKMSENLVLTPVDSSTPVNCTFQEELASDLCSSILVPERPAPSPGQASSHLAHPNNNSIEYPSHSNFITRLRNGMASLTNWSLRRKTKSPEEKKMGFLQRRTEPPPHASGVPEARSLQEKQEDTPPKNTEEFDAMQVAKCCSSYPSQDSEKHFNSALNLVEDSLKLCMQSQEEGESSGHCSSETLPCVKPSACPSTE